MRSLTITFALLLTFATGLRAADMGRNTSTITTKILAIESANANAMRSEFQTQDIIPYSFKVKGQTYDGILLSTSGHAKVFKETGGPYLRWLGLDFRPFTDPKKPYFYLYTGLLVFMIGLHWFSMVNSTASGKGKFEVIPLALKLMMGLIVAYNLPFVYGLAMSLKNLGVQIVAMAISNESRAETLSKAGSNAPIIINARQEAVREGVKRALVKLTVPITEVEPTVIANPNAPKTKTVTDRRSGETYDMPGANPNNVPLTILDTATADRNSGRARVAALVTSLNQHIGMLYGGRYVTLADNKGAKINASSINFVGFPKAPPSMVLVSLPGGGVAPVPTNDQSGRVISNPYAQAGQGQLNVNEALRTDLILQKFAYDEATANFLYDKYVERLSDFASFASVSYSQVGQPTDPTMDSPSALNGIRLLESGGAIGGAPKEAALGDILYPIDRDLVRDQLNDADMKTYRSAIADATAAWLLGNPGIIDADTLEKTRPDNAPKSGGGWFSSVTDGLATIFTNFFQWVIDLFVGIVKWFWIPALSYLATFVFNFTIEFYVYLLWLAYPLWFYKKTEKAFTGALDTLISTSFTVMTFCLLAYVFESFAGWLRSSLTVGTTLGVVGTMAGAGGAAAAAGATALATGATIGAATFAAPIAIGAALGGTMAIGVGFAVFYIVGTFLCFRLAPKVFQAWKEGSSVVTPMVGAAATAMVSGLAGGILAGFGAGSLAGGLTAVAGKSAVLGGLAKAPGAAAKWAKGTKAGQGISKAVESVGNRVSNFAQRANESPLGQAVQSVSSAAGRKVRAAGSYIANSRVGKAATAVGDAVSQDAKGVGDAVKTSVKEFVSDPLSGLSRMAQSKVAQIGIVTASGFGGDPSAPLKNLGTAIVATETLRRLGGNPGATVAATRTDKELNISVRVDPATAGPAGAVQVINLSTPVGGFTSGGGQASSQAEPKPNPAEASSTSRRNPKMNPPDEKPTGI